MYAVLGQKEIGEENQSKARKPDYGLNGGELGRHDDLKEAPHDIDHCGAYGELGIDRSDGVIIGIQGIKAQWQQADIVHCQSGHDQDIQSGSFQIDRQIICRFEGKIGCVRSKG